MRHVAKILATLLLLGWLACTLDTDNAPALAPPDPKWRRTAKGWRELSAWYIPDGHFHDAPLGPIAFAALQCAVVVTYLVLMPPRDPARPNASPRKRHPNVAARPRPGDLAASRPDADRSAASRPGVGRPGVGRLSAAVRPTANRRTATPHVRVRPPTRSSRANRPPRR